MCGTNSRGNTGEVSSGSRGWSAVLTADRLNLHGQGGVSSRILSKILIWGGLAYLSYYTQKGYPSPPFGATQTSEDSYHLTDAVMIHLGRHSIQFSIFAPVPAPLDVAGSLSRWRGEGRVGLMNKVRHITEEESLLELERRADELLRKRGPEAAHPLQPPARTAEQLDELPQRTLLTVQHAHHLSPPQKIRS